MQNSLVVTANEAGNLNFILDSARSPSSWWSRTEKHVHSGTHSTRQAKGSSI